MLNYVYGALLSSTQINVIAEGYDPSIGIVHDKRKRDRGRVPVFALDRMESQRTIADRAVLELVSKDSFSGADFQIQSDGAVRVNPRLCCYLVQTRMLVAE